MSLSVRLFAVCCALILTEGCGQLAITSPVTAPEGSNSARGREKIQYYGCPSCHTIPGIPGANGMVGPPLTQIARRVYIGGVLTNTPDNMIRWIENPKAADQLTAMPNLGVTPADARDITGYLYTLR